MRGDVDVEDTRRELIAKYGFAVPTNEALDAVGRCSPSGVVEVGAGTGYWAHLLQQRGVDVAAFDIEPGSFISQIQSGVQVRHAFIGIVKAPFMAIIIGIIACVEGFRVRGSAESLGAHTTSSVVKAIFMVIVVDGIFAMIFTMMDL